MTDIDIDRTTITSEEKINKDKFYSNFYNYMYRKGRLDMSKATSINTDNIDFITKFLVYHLTKCPKIDINVEDFTLLYISLLLL